MSKLANSAVFPATHRSYGTEIQGSATEKHTSLNFDGASGLTFRQYAAVAAMQGLCANPSCDDHPADKAGKTAANACYIADCLIAELEKKTP